MTIAEALRAAARYVEDHKTTLAWSGPEMPADDDKARLVAEVSTLGRELDSLAAASETATVYRREVEAVTRELQALGFSLAPEIAKAIAHAFDAAACSIATPAPRTP